MNCAGRTPGGQPFADIAEPRKLLAKDARPLAIGFTRHLITYATRTPPTRADELAIEAILQHTASADYPARALIHAPCRARFPVTDEVRPCRLALLRAPAERACS